MWWNMQQSFPTILKWTICWLHICFLVEFCFLELLEVDVHSVWLFVQCVPRGMRAKIFQNLPFWWHPSCYKFLFAILFSHVGETTWTQIFNQTLLLFTAKVLRFLTLSSPFLISLPRVSHMISLPRKIFQIFLLIIWSCFQCCACTDYSFLLFEVYTFSTGFLLGEEENLAFL